ncbi:MAG TPA: NAD-dependent epimerase/dehydratase family protein [Polyangiaceae bacterium]
MRWTLVTGASGFVGSRLVRALVDRGEAVKAFVHAGSSLSSFEGLPRDRFELAFGDVRVEHTVYRALASCERLYHVAASEEASSPPGSPAPSESPAVTRAVLGAARKRRLRRVVLTRSAAALVGTEAAEPLTEDGLDARGADLDAGVPLVTVLPACAIGPGDRRPACLSALIARYLRLPPSARVPLAPGGVSVVDVDDVLEGTMLAMQRGQPGERYLLGGENLNYEQLFTLLHGLTGLARPGRVQRKPALGVHAAWLGIKATLQGDEPLLTARLLRDYSEKYVFVSSAKAQRELGYSFRQAREALARAVLWFLEQGYVPEHAARRVRLELRPA